MIQRPDHIKKNLKEKYILKNRDKDKREQKEKTKDEQHRK